MGTPVGIGFAESAGRDSGDAVDSLTGSVSITRLRQMTRGMLRNHAVAEATSTESFENETERLANWYVMLRSDDRHVDSQLLQSTAAKVRVRLLDWSRDRQKQLRRERIPPLSASTSELDARIQRAMHPTDDPLRKANRGAAGGGVLADGGWQLVELIERIVRPDFWQSQGGPGVVHYFAARRVLVVRATSDVHQDLKDLLTALR